MLIKLTLLFGVMFNICLFSQPLLKRWEMLSRWIFAFAPVFATAFLYTLYFALDIKQIQNGYIEIRGLVILGAAVVFTLISIGIFSSGFLSREEAT